MTLIPRAAALAAWLNAWLRGVAAPDEVFDAVGTDLHHVIMGLEKAPTSLSHLLAVIRRTDSSVRVALPAAGDPVGLAGPASFNTAALDSGQALLLPEAGIGLVPYRVGGAMEWHALPAAAPIPLDPTEARQMLRRVLREVTEELVALRIATWNSDIPDLLINAINDLHLPKDLVYPDAVMSAAQCLAIIEAAQDVEPGVISAAELARFESAMRQLDRAARHALVAVCSVGSDSLSAS